jgi:RNA-dependent RNA polymerase
MDFLYLQEIQTYFVNYMQNDNLGTIANAHVVFADREPEKARSWQCKELAMLSSISVDFPKTGVAAILPKYLRPHVYPDFMEKRDKKSYVSRGVLGKLYRAAKMAAAGGDSLKVHADDVTRLYDKDLVQQGFERHLVTSLEYQKLYNARLRLLMDLYGVETEAEMVSGFFLELHPAIGNYSKRNSDPRKVEDKIHDAMKALRSEARSWYDDMIQEAKHPTARNEQYAIASSWYHVTYHPDFVKCQADDNRESKTPFLSFPWVLYDRLLAIKRNTALKKWNQTSNGVSPNKRLN